MQTVPPALDRGAGEPAKWETLGTAVPEELVALAGTGAHSAGRRADTGHCSASQE